ncbi:flagellar hook-length control protein FliK [Pseudomonas serbica]|uniref:flagellar hook-length control protein FliK n=1 Tax=Pseudomonas serbica TaxID=2965074 RepID=UPI00237BDA4C|nr:flagellar hook-length control protein FliK [Pseudomonas serbica]
MPLTPQSLLQAAAQSKSQAKSQSVSAPATAVIAEPRDKASSFSQVYARQARDKAVATPDTPSKSARDKVADSVARKDVEDKSAAQQPAVADSGKNLPADKPAQADDKPADADSTDAGQAPVVDAVPVDPASVPVVAAPASPVVTDPAEETLAALVAPAVPATDAGFDPEADPLDALPALRMAMEQSGHVSASSQAQPKAAPAQADGELTAAQTFAAGMANMLDVQADKDSTGQGGEKAFGGLIDAGLKDLTSASSDTRVDEFANRLAALTQAATPKTANAVPVNQPIAMHQSSWTEEVVNRVMYLSSANLKAADIQLQPAELGRLDIRVNMVPDQQTQVTFMSAHPGVREALDNQMHRLRDMFAQQGMGQVDVNVSDQSRGSQGQGQHQQAQSGRASASGGRLDAMDDEIAPSVTEVAATATRVIGSSAVDYYA